MLERKERSGGEAAGGGAGPRAAAARGLPAVRSTLQQCGLLQDLIDISLSNLRGLRTQCAASNDLTQQEIRTLEVRGSAAAAGPEGSPAPCSSQLGAEACPSRGPPGPAPSSGALSPQHRGPHALTGASAVVGRDPRVEGSVGGYVGRKKGRAPPARLQPCQQGAGPLPSRAVGLGRPWQSPPHAALRRAWCCGRGEGAPGEGAGEDRCGGAASRGGRGAPRAVRRVRGQCEPRGAVPRRPPPRCAALGPVAGLRCRWRWMRCEVGTGGDLRLSSRRWVATPCVLGSWIDSRCP